MSFQKQTPRQRALMRERRAAIRDRMRIQLRSEAIIAVFEYLGACDGPLNSLEISHRNRYLASVGAAGRPSGTSRCPLDSASTRRAMQAYVQSVTPTLSERRKLLRELRDFATCDGPLTDEEIAVLHEIEGLLVPTRTRRRAPTSEHNTGRRTWRSFYRAERGQARDKGQASPRVTAPSATWHYDLLGCSPSDTDETIKRSYRRMALKLHPDTHAASRTEADSHVRAFQKLQEAYEEIRKERKGTRA